MGRIRVGPFAPVLGLISLLLPCGSVAETAVGGSKGADAEAPADEAALTDMVRELQQLARRQQEKIEAYEMLVEKQHAQAPPRQLLDDEPSIFAGSQLLNGRREFTETEANRAMMTHVWLALCGAMVMFMQAGFAMMEVGMGRIKNAHIILIKNLTVVLASWLGWWSLGWSFAFSGPLTHLGDKSTRFIGYEQFFGHHFIIARPDGQMEPSMMWMIPGLNSTSEVALWFFTGAVCCVATVIASAGVTERMGFWGSLVFSFLFSALIWPFVAAWTWGGGFLADVNTAGFVDRAGSGIVFLCGGFSALTGALIARSRPGRFDRLSAEERQTQWPRSFQPHSMPLVVMGTFILWFGWYGLACGSTKSMVDNEQGMLAAQIAMNLTIAGAGAGLAALLLRLLVHKKYDIGVFCNGVIAGLVSISAGCGSVECGSAVAIGVVGSIFYFGTSIGLKVAKIDDPADAFAVYGIPGLWGTLAAVLFDWGTGFDFAHGREGFRCIRDQAGRCIEGTWLQLLAGNAALIGAVVGWSVVLSAIVFLTLKLAKLIDTSKASPEDKAPDDGDEPFPETSDYRYEDVYGNSSI